MSVDELLVARDAADAVEGDGAGLVAVVVEHQLRHVVGHLREHRLRASRPLTSPFSHEDVEQDLDVHLVVGHVDAAGVVDGVGVDEAAALPVLEAACCVKPRLPPSPTTRARTSVRVDAHAVVGAVADVGVVLGRRLDVGADAAVVEQVHLRGQEAADDLLAGALVRLDVEQLPHLAATAGWPWPSGRRCRRPR